MRRRTRLLLILGLLLVIVALFVRSRWRGPTIPEHSFLLLDLGGSYVEAPPQDLLGRLLSVREKTLLEVLTTVRKAQVDSRVAGIIVRIASLDTGWAKVQDIRDALLAFKTSGKPLLAVIEAEGQPVNKEFYLATVADRLYLPPNATAPLNGLAAHFMFLGGVWDKLDIQLHVEKIREYKTAGDFLGGKEMTVAHREMANSLLDSLNAQFVSGIATGRDLDPDTVRRVIDRCPVSPADYQAANLANGSRYLEDIRDEVSPGTKLLEAKDYAEVSARSLGLRTGPEVAVVYAVGTILPGESATSLQGEMLGARTLATALQEAADDEQIRAIVLRVDSPGGSALGSDLVWRATQSARKKKPLVVSMSDVAASGGYYIAAGANRIVAQPASLTGSIGVLSARPYVKPLLARLGINTATLTRGRFAAMDDVTTPFLDADRQRLVAELDHIYGIFVERVASGRGLTPERVNEIGRGRVWTGAQARDNGLIDELGGFATAVQAAKEAAGIDSGIEVELVFFPKPQGWLARAGDLIGTHLQAPLHLTAGVRAVLEALALPFEDGAILTVMPERIELR